MTPERATALRSPFPAESVGKLPKGGMLLDYVGHAAVTDRLLTVDPHWSWEPMAVGADGLPALDRSGNLWIRLTICGVTRIGVGDGKSAKECIGDAITQRRHALRGRPRPVGQGEPRRVPAGRDRPPRVEPPHPQAGRPPPEQNFDDPKPMTSGRAGRCSPCSATSGCPTTSSSPGINQILGTSYASRSELTEADAKAVIEVLRKKKSGAAA